MSEVVVVDDTIYVAVENNLIRSFRPGGEINTIAGIRGVFESAGNGGPAQCATLEDLGNNAGLRIGPDGSVYLAQRSGNAGTTSSVRPRRRASVGRRVDCVAVLW